MHWISMNRSTKLDALYQVLIKNFNGGIKVLNGIFSERKINELTERSMSLDKQQGIKCDKYDRNLFILKNCITEIITYIQPFLPYSNIEIEEWDNKNIASARYIDDNYTIVFNSKVLEKYDDYLKNIFKNDDSKYIIQI